MGTFLLLWGLVLPVALVCFAVKGAGEKLGEFVDMDEVNRKTWERLVGKSSDPCNVVTYAHENKRGVYYVTVENTRLGKKEVFGDKDPGVVKKAIRKQFEEWARM